MNSGTRDRNEFSQTIAVLEAWARDHSDVADIETSATVPFWKMSVKPHAVGACPFELILRADHRFDLTVGDETYEDKPIDTLAFFGMVARAIASGYVERVNVISAVTGAVDAVETHVTLEDGWAWIGERRTGPRGSRRLDTSQELRRHRFLAYRRNV
jgi:hypothetical protein